jgi:Leucine-rich repeat (LRR) protein
MKMIKKCWLFIAFFLYSQVANCQVSDSLCNTHKIYTSMEDALKNPLEVKYLDLSLQKIQVLPVEILQLKNLECLDLSFNRITSLPLQLVELEKLRYINLIGTRYLTKVPAVLSQMKSLEVVELGDHPEWTAAKYAEAQKLLPHVKITK